LLKLAKEKYSFISYKEVGSIENYILWRHDVDFSVHEAEELAIIEHEEGVRSTYFLLLHSEFYNLLEISVTKKIKNIIKLGHHIGLHFDPVYYEIKNEDELVKYLNFEKRVIEELFNININAFSFHNPTEELLKNNKFEYSGMRNTYAEYFKNQVDYCSDSNGYWRFKRLHDVINEVPPRLQVLTHPEWWTSRIMSPKEKVWRCADGRAKWVKQYYLDLLNKNDRKVIDWND
jgi:hypothetical protein